MAVDDGFYRMAPLELAAGWLPGLVRNAPAPSRRSTEGPLATLERILIPALQSTPCLVGFSGGRDSSAVLAATVAAARKCGLPLPVPVTNVFPDHPETDETRWQEMVVRHLGLAEWVRLRFDDELDLLGPAATASLRRHGLLWPSTIHAKSPFLDLAKGGVYLTGEGGDEILGPHRITPLTRLIRRAELRDLASTKKVLKAVAPRPVRRAVLRRKNRTDAGRSWLRAEAKAAFDRAALQDALDEPVLWNSSMRRVVRHRTPFLAMHNFDLLGAAMNVKVLHPLRDPRFVAALVNRSGANRYLGFVDRAAAMRTTFGEILPDAVLARESKVVFNHVYFGRYSREFVATWTGKGVDAELVDEDVLRKIWMSDLPHGGTYSLLHAAWLAQNVLPMKLEHHVG